jgi:cardiolipin synthase
MNKRHYKYLLFVLITFAAFTAFIIFIFNPFGLGPEPDRVLSEMFFRIPVQDLSQIELLIDGKEAAERTAELMDRANLSIFIQTFIWKDDQIGGLTADKLKTLAKKGIRVTVSKDLLGTFFELGDILKGKPSPVYTKSGLRGHENIQVKTSYFADNDHSKYIIVDDRSVVFGGMNIADEYHTKWHDYMVLISNEQWTKAFERRVLRAEPWSDSVPFVVAVNDRRATEIRTAYIQIFDNAKQRIIIEHAYFSDDKITASLERAAKRGIQIDVILPKDPDTHIYPNKITINRLLGSQTKNNINIYLYPQMSHAKVAMVDGAIAAVGSANLTPRSMMTTREVTVFIHGKPDDHFIRKLSRQLDADIAASEKVVQPFQLGFHEKLLAMVGKYVW